MRGLAYMILELLEREGPLSPGDAVSHLGAPRYKVLAAFQCLEELGLIAPLYKKGTYKIYQVTDAGVILRKASERSSIADQLYQAIQSLEALGSHVGSEAVAEDA
ncbi:MAG: helix-turn-helix domain-containing protein [Desulfurococcales archaeon]|nr:helix-turn-helix domain-containing protein [Desulfurococcales archaeon]